MELVDYLIALHGQDEDDNEEQEQVWYWANDVDEEYPMTYQLDADSMVSDSLLHDLRLDPSSTVPLTVDRQLELARYFKAYQPPQRLRAYVQHPERLPTVTMPSAQYDGIDEVIRPDSQVLPDGWLL